MKNQTLQGQFRLWTLLLVVVPSLLIMGIYTVGQIQLAKQQNLELIRQRVDFQRQAIEYWMEERSNDIRAISAMGTFRNLDEKNKKDFLDLMQRYSKDFDSLSYIDSRGFFRLTTLKSGIRAADASNQPYFKAGAAGKEYISDVVIGRNSGLPIINFSSPIYDGEGHFQGVILGSVRTTRLEELLRSSWSGETGEIILVNKDGTMLTNPRYAQVLIDKGLIEANSKMKFKVSDEALYNMHLLDSGTMTWVDYKDTRVMGAYQNLPDRNWTLVGSISEAEILAPIYRQLLLMSAATCFLLLMMLPIAAFITGQLKRPIDWLIEQSNLIALENYSSISQGGLQNMPQELNHLCETFVKMGQKIESTVSLLKENEGKLEAKVTEIQNVNAMLEEEVLERQTAEEALRKLNTELEDRVLKRTQELRDINTALEEEIRERQAAEEATKESRERYEALLKQSSEAVVVVDLETTQIIEVNDAFLQMFGYSRTELQPLMASGFRPLNIEGIQEIGATLLEGKPLPPLTATHQQASGEVIYLEGIGSLIYHRGRQLILISYRNVTDQKQAEIEKAENQKKVALMERMASLGTLSAGVAHEINQPLQALKVTLDGMIYWYERGKEPSMEKMIDNCRLLSSHADRINRIVKRMRDFVNRSQAAHYERIDLNTMVTQALDMLRERLKIHDIHLEEQLSEQPITLWGDSGRLEEVVINVTVNAIQALDSVTRQGKEIAITTFQNQHTAVLEIRNNGPTIPEEVMGKIFDPFFSTRISSENMGLGLAIVHSIIEAHQGIIRVSNLEDGVSFQFELPLYKDDA